MPEPLTPRPGSDVARRFLTLADVAEILATSVAQVRALVQSGELRYIQIGGRQQYRIETVELEAYIERMYARAAAASGAASGAAPGAAPVAASGVPEQSRDAGDRVQH